MKDEPNAKKLKKQEPAAAINKNKNISIKNDKNNPKKPMTTTTTATKPAGKNMSTSSKEHAKMLEAFWKLSEYNQNTRMDGISQIVGYFRDLDAVTNKDNYQYVLNRLVKGMASNRKCSRLGFSCCLTELINLEKPRVNMVDLVDLAKSLISSTKSDSTLTKEELRHMHIGFVFVYLCWIQSSRLNNKSAESTQMVKQALGDLNQMRKKADIKFYIQELYVQAIVLLVKKLEDTDLFKSVVLPTLESDLTELWSLPSQSQADNANTQAFKSSLNLLLACLNKSNELTTSKLFKDDPKSTKLKSVFSAKNFDLFYDILSQSSESLPKLQPICLELVEYLARHNLPFLKQLWSDLINTKLCLKKEVEKKIVCFKLYLHALRLVDKSNVSVLFDEILIGASQNILHSFANNYAYKTTNLNALCRVELARELTDIVRVKEAELGSEAGSSSSSTLAADLCTQLIRYTKNLHDLSDLTSAFVMHMGKNSLSRFFGFLINELLKADLAELRVDGDTEDERSLKEDSIMSKQAWLVNQLSNFSRNKLTFEDTGLLKQVLQYLSINAYFETAAGSGSKASAKYDIGLKLEKNEKLVALIRECLIEYIGILLTKHTFAVGAAANNDLTKSLYLILIESIEAIKSLIESKSSIKLNEKLIKKEQELKEMCVKIVKLLKNLLVSINNAATGKKAAALAETNGKEKSQGGSEVETTVDVYQTFFMVISIEFFRMFDSVKNSKQIVDDIEICMQKFEQELSPVKGSTPNKKKKSKNFKIYFNNVFLTI
jgi:hypothetical protein